MLKLLLLMVILLLGMLFLVLDVNLETKVIGFAFQKFQIRAVDYVYFLLEHVVKIILSYIIYAEATKYRFALFVFLLIQAGDLLDYMLNYNMVWYQFHIVPISMNTVGIGIFAMACFKEYAE